MYNDFYKEQFSLLLKVLPCLKEIDDFALKGGTAINLFYRNLPRVSVDIDLTYTKLSTREETIKQMNAGLETFSERVLKRIPKAKIQKRYSQNNDYIIKLNVIGEKSIVKIEPNFIFRGMVHPVEHLAVSSRVTEEFNEYIDEIPIASFYDVFAGKICAALNRQHPRDLFDIKLLLENEGLSDLLRKTFLVYLACDVRPINELLNPNLLDISQLYTKEFQDMTTIPVSLDELLSIRQQLISTLINSLTTEERNFLYSVKMGEPNYSLLPFENIDQLPALQWKLINIRKMDKKKHAQMLEKLRSVLMISM